jgi:hypothetical protein
MPFILSKIGFADHAISNNDQLAFIDNKIVHDFFSYLGDTFNSFKVSRSNTDEENLITVQKELKQLRSFTFQSISIDSIKSLTHTIEELLNLYIKIYSTNKWYLRWK